MNDRRHDYETRTGTYMADVEENPDDLDATDALHKALRKLQDFRQPQSDDHVDISEAHHAAMRATAILEEIEEKVRERELDKLDDFEDHD